VIELRRVGHVYGAGTPWAHRALEGVTLTIQPGERAVVVGSNGSGKSTLAWAIAGLLEPSEGSVAIDGAPVDLARHETAIAFQHARLQLFRATVGADVRFGTKASPWMVDEALTLVGLDPASFRSRRVDELSGGEQRRVVLAGAIVRRPRVLVLDEPLAGLDAPGRATLIELVRRVRATAAMAVVSVTHDLAFAHLLGDRAIVLERGRVVEDGPVDDVVRASSPNSPSSPNPSNVRGA
jgi:energy-coupling factor transport system ATP-binding protein